MDESPVKKIIRNGNAPDHIKNIMLDAIHVIENTDMSKLNYADTLASLKERSLKTTKHFEEVKKKAEEKQSKI